MKVFLHGCSFSCIFGHVAATLRRGRKDASGAADDKCGARGARTKKRGGAFWLRPGCESGSLRAVGQGGGLLRPVGVQLAHELLAGDGLLFQQVARQAVQRLDVV